MACAQLRPNLRGLFDIHGNAEEWCRDWFTERLSDNVTDPTGPEKGETKVLRGGGWDQGAWQCRSAARHQAAPETRDPGVGFRIVRILP
jgi:formylglycine-generating enzyme required for sulfatase activity